MKTEQEQVEELTQFMLEASDSANVEPVFECENGEEIRLNSGATSILNDILEQAFIPYLAQKLVKAGYGDVSENKAEIERLRTTLGQCNAELNSALKSLKSQCREIGELKAKNKVLGDGVAKAFTNGFNTGREQVEKDIRRAKIDILNEVKKCSQCDNFFPDGNWHRYVLVSDIDILIKEIEEQ